MDMNPLAGWDGLAEFWDSCMGTSGNAYFTVIELPALERMVQLKPGDRALDLATGNGLVAHWLARGGASVVATDGSPGMVGKAQGRQAERLAGIETIRPISYQVLDVTSHQKMEEFIDAELSRGGQFDIITMNMAIMDVSTLDPLAAALPKLLKPNGGRFVATLLHPFFTSGASRNVEYVDNRETGREEAHYTMKMDQYLHVPILAGVADQRQPHKQVYFHRPMHELFSTFFRTGLILDSLEEPNFDDAYVEKNNIDHGSLRRFTQFPKLLAFRLRVGVDRN
ncbi:hypothetical protein FQN57_007533 [Myotisia sp. PD_48]|nr:hypothetical protein FQN57_007533 [Myotisia sp. PD_48]